jgi:hypothetical protein
MRENPWPKMNTRAQGNAQHPFILTTAPRRRTFSQQFTLQGKERAAHPADSSRILSL